MRGLVRLGSGTSGNRSAFTCQFCCLGRSSRDRCRRRRILLGSGCSLSGITRGRERAESEHRPGFSQPWWKDALRCQTSARTFVTSSREWEMQCASAMVIVAFATSMWVAGQRFIQHGASKQQAPIPILSSVLPCADRALIGGDRIRQFDHVRGRNTRDANPGPCIVGAVL